MKEDMNNMSGGHTTVGGTGTESPIPADDLNYEPALPRWRLVCLSVRYVTQFIPATIVANM